MTSISKKCDASNWMTCSVEIFLTFNFRGEKTRGNKLVLVTKEPRNEIFRLCSWIYKHLFQSFIVAVFAIIILRNQN